MWSMQIFNIYVFPPNLYSLLEIKSISVLHWIRWQYDIFEMYMLMYFVGRINSE